MGNENYHSPNAKFLRYDVSYENGKFVERKIFEEPTHLPSIEIYEEDTYPETFDQQDEQPQTKERRRVKGKTIAKAAIAISLAMSVTYAADAVSTFIQKDGKVITPSDAYDDLTELPELVDPAVDKVRAITTFVGGK